MDELTRITHGPAGYTITTGCGLVLAEDATRDDALTALWHREFTPLAAVTALAAAKRIGYFTVRDLAAA